MTNARWALGLSALALVVTAAAARADRLPSTRVPSPPPATGTRPDIFVPYTTNGYSTLGVWQFVGPRIYSSPIVDDPKNPGAKPVYNLPFWGGVMDFGDRSNGATPRLPGPPLGPSR
jgi:hypothetical protein